MWYYSDSSECDIQMKKWNNKMTHGMSLCVCCMCSVMKEGMCGMNPMRSVMHVMVWCGVEGDRECDVVDLGHSIEHSQTQ